MPAINDPAVIARGPFQKNVNWQPRVVGVVLLLLLVFTTVTVFVQDAWPAGVFQIGVYTLTAIYLLWGIRRGREHLAGGWAPWIVYGIPVWGVIQLLAHTTASTVETREAVLRWSALAAIFFLTQVAAQTHQAREALLLFFLCFAAVMAILCLLQIFTSGGRVLWIFPSGYDYVCATFAYRNNYAQFIEISLPIALWRALRQGWRGWGYALTGGLLYASVIGTASRSGTIVCTAELLVMLAIGLIRRDRLREGLTFRSTVAIFVLIPIFATICTCAVGWQEVWLRFQNQDLYEGRVEFSLAALDMAKHQPLTGYGLGTFSEVYQQHALMDLPVIVNHAHDDWAEFAADGGIPFFLLIFIPFAAAVPAAFRHPWGLGLVGVMLHGFCDYPFPRPAVSGWLFAMLALLYMAQTPGSRGTDDDLSRSRSRVLPFKH